MLRDRADTRGRRSTSNEARAMAVNGGWRRTIQRPRESSSASRHYRSKSNATTTCRTCLTRPLVPRALVDDIPQPFAGIEAAEIVREERDERVPMLRHRARSVRRDETVGKFPIGTVGVQRFARETVEPGAAEA